MAGARVVERIVRDWVVEWDEPELEGGPEAATDGELRDAVRRRVADQESAAGNDARRADRVPSITTDGWMPGEPLF